MARGYRSDPVGDVVGGALVLAGIIAIAGINAIADLFHTPTEEKLRNLTPKQEWGAFMSDYPCPRCATSVESTAQRCYACGERL